MDLAKTLVSIITQSTESFDRITETEWTGKPNPRKWSKKEILGHLIDSALNNIRRFNEVQFENSRPYVVVAYRQEELVRANHYQELPVNHLIALWKQANLQLAYVLTHLTYETLQIVILTSGESKTVGWLAEDYVIHLRHHLDQIFHNT